MPITAEQAETELKKRRATEELARRKQPDFGMIAVRRDKLPGVFDNPNKQLDQLLGDGNLDDLLPLDVRFDFGRVVGMTEKPDETRTKMELSLLYKSLADIPTRVSYRFMDEFNRVAFNKPIDVKKAMSEYKDYYTGAKTYVGVLKHGFRRAGVGMVKGLAGKVKMVGELTLPTPKARAKKVIFPQVRDWGIEQSEKLIGWGNDMGNAVDEYYREHKAEAIQILPGIGYWNTIKEYITKPTNLVQGIVESSPLILEGLLGNVFGGTAAAITTMSLPITGQVYFDARKEGTDVTPAFIQAILTGTGEAAIEQWTLSRKLGLMKNYKAMVADGLPKILWEGTKAFFRGTAEEGTQELNRNIWQWLFTDRSQQWMANVKESMAAGGPIELAMAGAFSAAGYAGAPVTVAEQLDRVDKIQDAVKAEPTLTKEHKTEILQELDKVKDDVKQDVYAPVEPEPEKPPEAAEKAPSKPVEPITKPEAVEVDGVRVKPIVLQKNQIVTDKYFDIIETKDVPPVKEGYIRLYRGQSEGRVEGGEFFTPFLNHAYSYAQDRAKIYGGQSEITYIDLPKDIANKYASTKINVEDLGMENIAREYKFPQLLQPLTEAKPVEAEGKVEKPAEKKAAPVPKFVSVEKEIIPKQTKEKFTPPEVQKETKAEIPESDSETQNAVNLMEGYWRQYDERELEINVAATKNQEAIIKALGKKQYLPESDIETSKMSQAMMLYIDLKEHPSGHQFAEKLSKLQKEVYELSKNLPAQMQRIADSIIKQNREAGKLAIDKEIISVARENYIAHLWEKPTQKEALRARFRTTTARAKARTLEGGIMEGWAKGKKLRVDDVTLATQIAQSQINQAIVGREMLKLGKKWGLLSHKQPEGWVRVEHPGFTTWKWSGKAEKAKTYGRNFFVTEEGDLMERVPVYAEPELGKKLNNVFSPSALYKVPGIETISRYNAQIKSTILFTSLYHHQAFMRSYAFGSRGLNPKEAYVKGREAIMNMTPEVRLLVRNGLTIGRIQDYDPRMIEGEQTIWGRALSHTKLTESARKKLVDLRKRQERFLFNKLGPALKIQAGILELKAELKRNQAELESGEITADEIAAAVANLMNNDFGGLHLGRMGRSQTAQHIFRLLALAPDWTESNIRSAVQSFSKGETGYLHRMFWGRIAIKGLGATILFNLLLSAFDDDDFAERYKKAWETGRLRWLDIDITPIHKALGGADDKRKYFSLLGHFRDPIKFVAHPFVSAKHKGSVVSRIMMDMMIGEDWAGRKFTTLGELTGITEDGKNSGRLVKYGRGGARPIEPSQIPSYVLYEVRSAMPIPIQNIVAFLGGEMDAFDAITKSAGLMTATTYPERRKGITINIK